MKVGVYSRKGGVGKSSISVALSYYLDSVQIISNDFGGSFHKYDFYEAQEDPASHEHDGTLVYDFGGYIDANVLDILKECDVVVLPTDEDESGVQELLNSIAQIEELNNNIIVIHNKWARDETTPEDVLEDNFGEEYPLFKLRDARKVFRKALNEGLRVGDIIYQDNRSRYVHRNLIADLEAISEAVKIIGGAE